MTVPLSAARFLGAAIDRDQLGAGGDRVLHLTEGALGSAGANYQTVADSVEGVGRAYNVFASGTAGTRGPDLTFNPVYKPLGAPQADGANNIDGHNEVYMHERLCVQASSWDGAVGGYVETSTIEGTGDPREIRDGVFRLGAYEIVNRAGNTGTVNPLTLPDGSHPIGSYVRRQRHYRRTNGATPGRMAVRFETGTPFVYGAWSEIVDADISPNLIDKVRLGARDVGQNLGTNGHPNVLVKEVGWYVPLPAIDFQVPAMLTGFEEVKGAEDFLAYATPDLFALCRTGDFDHQSVKLVLGLQADVVADGGEVDWELGTIDGGAPGLGQPIPNPATVSVTVTNSGTGTLGADARIEGVLVSGLAADTMYAWRASSGGKTSGWRFFRTAAAPGVRRALRYIVIAHCHSDGRRQPNVAFRRAAELYRAGLIDFVVLWTKSLLHMDNNGQRTACLTLAEIFQNYIAAGMDPFFAELSATGCPMIPLEDDYGSFATNCGKWCENIPTVYPGGHPQAGVPIRLYTGYDADGDGDFTSINEVAPDSDYNFAAGQAITFPAMAAVGVAGFDAITKQYFLDESAHWRFLQQGAIDLCLLHDRNTRDPIGGADFLGAAQIAAVSARIASAPARGVRLVEIWSPSTFGNVDAATGESYQSWPTERAAAMQEWVDEAAAADVYLSFRSSCKNEPAVMHPDSIRALVAGNADRIVAHDFLGKGWGRIPNHNASLDANAHVLKAFLADGVNTLLDPYDGASRTVAEGDHVGWLPIVNLDPSGAGSCRTRLLSVVDLEPIVDGTHGAFDITVALGLPDSGSNARGRGRARGSIVQAVLLGDL